MQIELVDFQTASKNKFEKLIGKISQEEKSFIKSNYKLTNGGFFVLYSYQIQNLNAQKKIDGLLKKGIGIYSSRFGHSISSQLFNLI
jgi:hypothetical protein